MCRRIHPSSIYHSDSNQFDKALLYPLALLMALPFSLDFVSTLLINHARLALR